MALASAKKPTPHVVKGLENKYRRTLGERDWLRNAEYEWEGVQGYKLALDEWKRRLTSLNLTLVAIERTIRLFEQEWDGTTLAPIAFRPKRPQQRDRAGYTPQIAKVLREAKEPLTVSEIAERLAKEAKLKTNTREQRQRLYGIVFGFLERYREKGMVLRYPGKPSRWRLSGTRRTLPSDPL